MSTFLALVQDLHRECNMGGTSPTTLVGATGNTARLKNWVLQAEYEIKSRWFNWNFLWAQKTGTTTSSVSTLTAPTDMNVLDKDTFIINGNAVSVIDYLDYRRVYLTGIDENAVPAVVTRLPSGVLKLYPTPDASTTTATTTGRSRPRARCRRTLIRR